VCDPYAQTGSPDIFRQIVRCNRQFFGTPRYDWVVLYDLADNNFEKRQGIDKYLFAQVHVLFEIKHENSIHHLAYLEWFDITDVAEDPKVLGKITMVTRDPETQMAVAVRSGKFNVVSVNAIIRTVHMQPLFPEQDSAQNLLKANLDVYSFHSYLVNKYVDRISWDEIF
jgi:hypothetical protein